MTERRQSTEVGTDGGTGDQIKATARQAQEKVSDAAREVRDRGEHLVEEAGEKGRELTDEARDAARSRADEEKDRLAGGMHAMARALRRGSDDLPEDQRMYGRFLEGVAERVDGASRYLNQHDVDDLGREVSRMARNHAPAFIGGAFLLGMVGARFLKSSPDEARRDELRQGSTSSRSRVRSEIRYGSEEPVAGRAWSAAIPPEERSPMYDPIEEGDDHARGL